MYRKKNAKIANIFGEVTKCYLVWHPQWHWSGIHNGCCLPTQTEGGCIFLIVFQRGCSVSQMFKQSIYGKKKNRADLFYSMISDASEGEDS